MALTLREQKILEEEKGWLESQYSQDAAGFDAFCEKVAQQGLAYLPEDKKRELFTLLDNVLFHLHAMIQGAQLQMEARDRILTTARLFNEDIETLQDMHRLTIDQIRYIAKQQIAMHRVYSFAQGGVSGMGGAALLSTDIPAVIFINMRLVQLIAMSYGYEMNTPKEMMTSLKVFHTGSLPERYRRQGIDELMDTIRRSDQTYFFEGDEEIVNDDWFGQPLKQLVKLVGISSLRKRKVKGIPLAGIMIGAGSNYIFTKRISEFAHHFYSYRHLQEKSGEW
ncbi:MAG: EcsC family protein [Bacillus sp. (in: firmicutes)]